MCHGGPLGQVTLAHFDRIFLYTYLDDTTPFFQLPGRWDGIRLQITMPCGQGGLRGGPRSRWLQYWPQWRRAVVSKPAYQFFFRNPEISRNLRKKTDIARWDALLKTGGCSINTGDSPRVLRVGLLLGLTDGTLCSWWGSTTPLILGFYRQENW